MDGGGGGYPGAGCGASVVVAGGYAGDGCDTSEPTGGGASAGAGCATTGGCGADGCAVSSARAVEPNAAIRIASERDSDVVFRRQSYRVFAIVPERKQAALHDGASIQLLHLDARVVEARPAAEVG
jgi:hypothetical protein